VIGRAARVLLAAALQSLPAEAQAPPRRSRSGPVAARALVAAEVIAIARGHAGLTASAEPQLASWIRKVRPRPDAGLVARAVQTVDRLLGENSELRELWEESGEYEAWCGDVLGLRERLLA